MSRYLHRDLPLMLVGSFVIGHVLGQSFATVWVSGPAGKQGIDRVAHGVAELVSRRWTPTVIPTEIPTEIPAVIPADVPIALAA